MISGTQCDEFLSESSEVLICTPLQKRDMLQQVVLVSLCHWCKHKHAVLLLYRRLSLPAATTPS